MLPPKAFSFILWVCSHTPQDSPYGTRKSGNTQEKVKKLKAMQLPESQEKTRGKAGRSSSVRSSSHGKCHHGSMRIRLFWTEGGQGPGGGSGRISHFSSVRALSLKWGWYKAGLPPGIVTLLITHHPLPIQPQNTKQIWIFHSFGQTTDLKKSSEKAE